MPKRMQILGCTACGNIVEVLVGSPGALVCCGQDMSVKQENSSDVSREEHVPVLTRVADGWEVSVGSRSHPMETTHYIQLIELITENRSFRSLLAPTNQPRAYFPVNDEQVTARALCNLHGIWKT